MRDAILNFTKQFAYEPKIGNDEYLRKFGRFVVCGMGGSHLAAGILQSLRPELPLTVHRDYGLPVLPSGDLQNSLIIASSYSGNTEEVVDGFLKALEQNLGILAVATGGELLKLAKESRIPYIELPNTGIQPRSALGFSFRAMLLATGQSDLLQESNALAEILRPRALEEAGKKLAEKFRGKAPVVYTSTRNLPIAYNWKIKLNETGKIPAFYNVLPELNHNEMTGFDVKDKSRELSERFVFMFLRDTDDHPRIQKRFAVLERLYRERGLPVEVIALSGQSTMEKFFQNLLLADWFAYYTAQNYGLEPEQVPMVEEFKKLVR